MSMNDERAAVSGRDSQARELRSGDAEFPARLGALTDPPERLFVRGRIPAGPLVAIVGSREADAQMRRLAAGLASGLVSHGLVVLSGGARGIDTAAHEGALDGGGATVAVIGSGFDHMYPQGNRRLFERVESSGALLTEFEPSTPPARWTFPRRNRIVAALASAVVVVQASERSGALITAEFARELGVPLGAVPGAAGDLRSRGCNRLIRTGAVLIEELADVLALLDRQVAPTQLGLPAVESRCKETPRALEEGLSDLERAVLDRIGGTPVHIDDIASGAGLPAAEAAAAILNLELAGLVEDRGGKSFIRVG
jgi:DNA processing protein